MKKITEMELCMENMETIKLLPHEFSNCEIGNIVESVALTSAGMMQFQSTDAASFTMKSSANRTYNSFGHASQKTIFARFCSPSPTERRASTTRFCISKPRRLKTLDLPSSTTTARFARARRK
ncbi:MAG: hypothetical protein PUC99_10240 [Eubacteriales bacterium]|nr:hypothetical protein [Eubacteriales bacterium]